MHEHKIPVSLSTQCSLHNSAGKSMAVGDSQSSRRRARGNSIASKASGPNDTELGMVRQAPFLHWQILTFTVCVVPAPCRSVTSMRTSCIPVLSSLVCCNVAAVAKEETRVKVTKGLTFLRETATELEGNSSEHSLQNGLPSQIERNYLYAHLDDSRTITKHSVFSSIHALHMQQISRINLYTLMSHTNTRAQVGQPILMSNISSS